MVCDVDEEPRIAAIFSEISLLAFDAGPGAQVVLLAAIEAFGAFEAAEPTCDVTFTAAGEAVGAALAPDVADKNAAPGRDAVAPLAG